MAQLQLYNPALWQLVYDTELDAPDGSIPGSYVELSPVILTQLLSSSYVALSITSRGAKVTWQVGCWFSSVYETQGSFIPNLYVSRKPCRLNRNNLIEVNKLQDAYIGIIEFPYWIDNAKIKVWEYLGIGSESTDEFLQNINNSLL